MWILILITLFNAAVGSHSFLFENRISLGGLPVNILDMLLAFGLMATILPPGPRYVHTERAHPLLGWVLALWIGAIALGAIVGIGNLNQGTSVKQYVTGIRNWLVLPMGVMIGYRLLRNHGSVRVWPYVQVIAGVMTAVMVILFFRGQAEYYSLRSSIESLRTIDYIMAHAGIAAAVTVFSAGAGVRLFPWGVAVLLGGLCIVGNFAALSRSDWLATIVAILACLLVQPRQVRSVQLARGAMSVVVLLVFLVVGISMVSAMTQQNFAEKLWTRIKTLLPGEQEGVKLKAWDTRLYGSMREVEEWSRSPLLGRGISVQDTSFMQDADQRGARHNSYTSVLVETGPVGLAAAVLTIGGCAVLGWRMVRSRVDRGSALIGAVGVATGVYYAFYSFATGAFNNQRGGLLLSVVCGVILRARALQQQRIAELAGYVDFDHFQTDEGSMPFAVDDNGNVWAPVDDSDPMSHFEPGHSGEPGSVSPGHW